MLRVYVDVRFPAEMTNPLYPDLDVCLVQEGTYASMLMPLHRLTGFSLLLKKSLLRQMIWKEPLNLESLNTMPANIATLIGIEFTAWDDNSLTARMPVDARTHQPMGILHGGASVVLAESLGSIASNLIIDNTKHMAVGLEVNANHLRPVAGGFVTGTCSPIHLGSKTHVWDIRIVNERGKLVCISRLTVAIVARVSVDQE